jgi:hypothetical protein
MCVNRYCETSFSAGEAIFTSRFANVKQGVKSETKIALVAEFIYFLEKQFRWFFGSASPALCLTPINVL